MSKPARIAFVCEGDAESYDKAFSGSAKSMVDHLRALGHEVTTVNARVEGKVPRAINALRSFSPNKSAWRARFRHGGAAFKGRSEQARRQFEPLRGKVDVIFQIGGTMTPPANEIPYVLYCDWNMALSIKNRGNEMSSMHALSPAEAERINDSQRRVYQGAATIFTICDRLRGSFVEDYNVPAENVVTAYAGANLDLSSIPPRPATRGPDHRPAVLFIGKEFRRKGGDTLLAAFRQVRQSLPTARLLILGTRDLEVSDPGVEVLGVLRKDVPAERDRLMQVFQDADVFCLPSRHDPFPNAVREAMFFRLPCVTSDIWAFPEMVVDGETGYTVPPTDAAAFTDRLTRVLRDPATALRMGEAGRQRAERLFTWDACAKTLHDRIQEIALSTGPARR